MQHHFLMTVIVAIVLFVDPGRVLLAQAVQTPSPTRVTFKSGTTSTTLSGSLTGDALKTYVLSGRKGQTVEVTLKSARASWLVIRLYPDGAPEGKDVLSNYISSETSLSGTLPTDGDYILQLGLRRPEARRGGKASYDITASLK